MAQDAVELYCPECGYDLRGASGESVRCPECGGAYERARLAESRVPWMHRGEIGRVRAWWRTCWAALFRPGELAGSLTAALPYSDARRFWLICVAVLLPVVLMPVALLYESPVADTGWGAVFMPPGTGLGLVWENVYLPWQVGAEHLWLALVYTTCALVMATGAMSYVTALMPVERRRQDRAAALGLYAAGAMVTGLLPGALLSALWVAALVNVDGSARVSNLLVPAWVTTVGFAVVLWWIAVQGLYRRACQAGLGHRAIVTVAVVLVSAVSVAVSVLGLPFAVGMIRVFIAFFE